MEDDSVPGVRKRRRAAATSAGRSSGKKWPSAGNARRAHSPSLAGGHRRGDWRFHWCTGGSAERSWSS